MFKDSPCTADCITPDIADKVVKVTPDKAVKETPGTTVKVTPDTTCSAVPINHSRDFVMVQTQDAMPLRQVAKGGTTGIENHTSAVTLGATGVANGGTATLVTPDTTNTIKGGPLVW